MGFSVNAPPAPTPPPVPIPPPAAAPPTMANAGISASAAEARTRAAMAEGKGSDGTIQTSEQGAPPPDTAKTLLGGTKAG